MNEEHESDTTVFHYDKALLTVSRLAMQDYEAEVSGVKRKRKGFERLVELCVGDQQRMGENFQKIS